MNIINSDIITSENDALWAGVSHLINEPVPKPVLIITSESVPGSPEDAQLKRMIEGAKLTNDQYHLIDLKQGQLAAWHRLRELLDPRIIFLIGISPAQLGISALFRLNEPNSFNDRIWLPTLSVKELEENPAVKTQLWNNGMKPVFIEKKFGQI